MSTKFELSMPTPSVWAVDACALAALGGVAYAGHAPNGTTNGSAPATQIRLGGMKTRDAVATQGPPRGTPH